MKVNERVVGERGGGGGGRGRGETVCQTNRQRDKETGTERLAEEKDREKRAMNTCTNIYIRTYLFSDLYMSKRS